MHPATRRSRACTPLLLLAALLAACACRPPAGAPADPAASHGEPAAAPGDPAAASLATVGVPAAGASSAPAFTPIAGFSDATNAALGAFLERVRVEERGRKVAVFDGDGTVFGQVPHYLADECLYAEAAQASRRPEVIAHMTPLSNVSLPYVQDRVHYYRGETVERLRALGDECFRRWYAGKIYEPMRALVGQLQAHGFEVWIVTASPEAMYQGFLSRELGVPITRIIGVKAVVHGGQMTDRIVEPVPQDEGKMEAIETFVQERPLLAGGNSRGDREMIEHSRGLRMIVNPDEHIADGDTESMADYARRQGWLVERVRDVAEPGFPAVSSRVFGVRLNKPHE